MFEIIPNEVWLIAASFVNTVLYAIGASVALAFVGLTNVNSWSLGTILYWAQTDSALQGGAWWWFVPAGLAVAFIGTSLVLLNSGIDELGSPRLRASVARRRSPATGSGRPTLPRCSRSSRPNAAASDRSSIPSRAARCLRNTQPGVSCDGSAS